MAVCGAAGRMGRALVQVIAADPQAQLSAAVEYSGHPMLGQDAGVVAGAAFQGVSLCADLQRELLLELQVMIDFSLPEPALQHARWASDTLTPLVIGTTGFTELQRLELLEIARTIPVVISGNYSVGVNIALDLVRRATLAFGAEYDVELVEAHHRHKIDAPSGTALMLAETVAEARNEKLATVMRCGRESSNVRAAGEIGIHSVRGGDVVGEHQVWFIGEGERLEIRHVATSRLNFAQGAVRAAHWLVSQSAGMYSMRHVLGLDPLS